MRKKIQGWNSRKAPHEQWKKRVKGFIFVQVLNLVLDVSIYFYQ
jgi:hypothetical protein